jgi:undecaprenyl-phosphate 4-deoxy-4-formamido-L-arabinose transferase
MTGLRWATGDFIAIMDDDLQHDPRDLVRLAAALDAGFDVAYANFRSKQQALWKNIGSWLNGRIAEWVIRKPRGIYLSPYKVIRADVAKLITNYAGPSPYIDGLLFQVTSRITQIDAEHRSRHTGTSNFTLWKSARVALRLILSFSPLPLRMVALLGLAFCILGAASTVAVISYRLLRPEEFTPESAGWASLMSASLFLGGVQLGCLGIVGEYVARLFLAVNRAPQAAVGEIISQSRCATAVADATPSGNKILD